MNNFIITTDTTSDLPAAYVEQHQIGMLSLTYTINDTTYSWEHPLPVKEFYDCMRQGSLPTTSQANPEEAAAVFEKIINEQNADILHIAFSSGLSGSYNSARLAAGELSEKYPDRKIIVIDSLEFSEPKTKEMIKVLANVKAAKKALIVTAEKNENVVRSAANIPGVKTSIVSAMNTYEIVNATSFIVTKDAVEKIQEVYS